MIFSEREHSNQERSTYGKEKKDNKKDQNQLHFAETLRKSGIPNGVIA